ncbi:MAG: thioredoxin family protein [Candidatus Sumerlaeaceae bacterium]|nr:thioredoxin family protein [Candidatus Sumerlaeaceae bacterium]
MISIAWLLTASGSVQAAEWEFVRLLRLSGYVPVFVAVTPSGDIVVATFNSKPRPGLVDLPVVLIHKPLSAEVQYYVVCKHPFDTMRGYSGVAVDEAGNFYIAADTGNGATSWIRRYKPDGTLDKNFGTDGEIKTGRRMLGLDLTGKFLFSTAAFGELMVFDRETGKLVGSAPRPDSPPLIRDVAVDPARQTVYGVAQGAAWVWEGGTFEKPSDYKLRRLSPNVGEERAGEGIYFDAVSRRALMPDSRSGNLLSVSGNDGVRSSRISEPTPNYNSLADAALLTDGSTLVVTDMALNTIYIMKRSATVETAVAEASAPAPAGAPPSESPLPALAPVPSSPADTPPPLAPVPAVAPIASPATDTSAGGIKWLTDYEAATAEARSARKPLLLFGAANDVPLSQEVESGYLSSPEFTDLAKHFVLCRLDVTRQRQLALKLGIFRVPYIAVYSPDGNRLVVFLGKKDGREISAKLKELAGVAP